MRVTKIMQINVSNTSSRNFYKKSHSTAFLVFYSVQKKLEQEIQNLHKETHRTCERLHKYIYSHCKFPDSVSST